MRKLLKYKLLNGTIPSYIDDGGYFPDGDWLVGISVHLDDKELPKDTTWMSRAELQALINTSTIMDTPGGIPTVPLTIEVFEDAHSMYRYNNLIPEDRLAAIEMALLEL